MRRFRRPVVFAAIVGCVSLTMSLGACTVMQGDGSEPAQPAEASPTPSLTTVGVAPIAGLALAPGDELFTFSAKAVTEYGAQLQITMTLHEPVAWNSSAGDLVLKYLASQQVSTSMTDSTWDAENNVSFGVLDISAVAAGEPWLEGSTIQLELGPFITKDVVFGLTGRDESGRFILGAEGAGHAIVAFPAFDGSPDGKAWAEARQSYGLTSASDGDLAPTFQECTITFTEAGRQNDWIANWFKPNADSCRAGIDE